MKILNLGGRMIPVGHLQVGQRVIAYNPHLHAIAREGNHGQILPLSEMPVRVTDYYLGCFQRGSLFALEEDTPTEKKPPQMVPDSISQAVETKSSRKKKEEKIRNESSPISEPETPKEVL